LQGLKPDVDLIGLLGMTEVMPCYKALRNLSSIEFSATSEADIDLIGFIGTTEVAP